MDAESRVAELLGDDLHGERVVCAVYATTRRWYALLSGLASRSHPGEHNWWLALTDERLLIVSAKDGETGWRAKRNVQARRSDVEVERFSRTGIATWWLVLNVRTEGRWSLHAVTTFGVPLGSSVAKARQIAESLGWALRT